MTNHVERQGHVPEEVVLTCGGDALRLTVFQVAQPHEQPALIEHSIKGLDHDLRDGIATSGVVFRGVRGVDVAALATFADEPTTGPNTYTVELVDRVDDEKASVISADNGLCHFVNVFQLAPGRREATVDYFAHALPVVRRQPGYVSANILVSTDGTQAANVGQFRTEGDLMAIFRRPEIVTAFTAGAYRWQFMRSRLGPLPHIPRLRVYDIAHVAAVSGSVPV